MVLLLISRLHQFVKLCVGGLWWGAIPELAETYYTSAISHCSGLLHLSVRIGFVN